MTRDAGDECTNLYFSIFESEAKVIAGTSAAWGGMETGGALFGFQSHGRRPIALIATTPCAGARHEHAHFADDVVEFEERARRLSQWGGLQVVGTWHSHHNLGLQEPSGGDRKQVQSITGGNGYPSWVEIITTHRSLDDSASRAGWWPFTKKREDERPSGFGVQLNTFFYANPSDGRPQRCRIKVIPGMSPYRQALLHNGILSEDALGLTALGIATNRIFYDKLDSESECESLHAAFPVDLTEQINSLADPIRKTVQVTSTDEFWVIAFQVGEVHRVQIAFDRGPQPQIKAAYLLPVQGGKPKDFTKTLHSWKGGMSLEGICRRLEPALTKSLNAGPAMPNTKKHASIEKVSPTRVPSSRGKQTDPVGMEADDADL